MLIGIVITMSCNVHSYLATRSAARATWVYPC